MNALALSPDAGVYAVLAALAPRVSSYLGIGVQEGGCVAALLEGNPGIGRLTLCDTWGLRHGGTGRGSHAHIEQLLRDAGYQGAVTFLDGPSQERVPALAAESRFDLAFVDGDHGEEMAYQDFRNAWDRIEPEGAMVVHDTAMPPVASAIARFLSERNEGEISSRLDFTGWTGTVVLWRAA